MKLDNSFTITSLISRIPTPLIVAGSSWLNRIVSAIASLFSVRLLIEGLGTKQYAAFTVISSLLGWFMLLEMGVGASLQNYISEQRAKAKPYNEFMTAACLLATVIMLVTISGIYYISPYVAPLLLKNFDFIENRDKAKGLFIASSLFTGVSVGSIAYKVWYAQQKGYFANIISALTSILGCGGVWLVTHSELPNKLLGSLIALFLPVAFLSLLSFLWQVMKDYKFWWQINWLAFWLLMKRASRFWLFSIMSALTLQVDYLIMSQFVSAPDIVIYNICTKVFGLGYFFYASTMAALWPTFTELITKNEWNSVVAILKKSTISGIVLLIAYTIFVAIFMPQIIHILSPHELLVVPLSFIVLFGVYQIVLVWINGFSIVLQSASDMSLFLKWTPIQLVASVSLQWMLAPRYGIYGIALGLMLSFFVTSVWLMPYRVKQLMKISKDITL